MKRYDPDIKLDFCNRPLCPGIAYMDEHPDGDYVPYYDVEPIIEAAVELANSPYLFGLYAGYTEDTMGFAKDFGRFIDALEKAGCLDG